jgi:hypothetical protein
MELDPARYWQQLLPTLAAELADDGGGGEVSKLEKEVELAELFSGVGRR